jgi:excisionase family DNA binding protein
MASFEHEQGRKPPQEPLPPFAVSVEEAERLSAIGRTKLYELMQKGRIKSRKVGRRRLVIVHSLRTFLENEED